MNTEQMMERAEQRAVEVLDSLPEGGAVVFEGSCPSGPTYEGRVWHDGTAACRKEILEKARRLGYPDAWRARLVAVKDVGGEMAVAEMRTP